MTDKNKIHSPSKRRNILANLRAVKGSVVSLDFATFNRVLYYYGVQEQQKKYTAYFCHDNDLFFQL